MFPKIIDFLHKEDLEIKNNYQLFRINSRPLDFVGYKFLNNKVYLRKGIYKRIRRKILKIQRQRFVSVKDARTLMTYYGWKKNTDCKKLFTCGMNNLFEVCKQVMSKNKIIKEV